MDAALVAFPLRTWSVQFACHEFQLAARFKSKPTSWPARAALWDPGALFNEAPAYRRGLGRPRRKWDDHLMTLSIDFFAQPWHDVPQKLWFAKEQEFVSHVTSLLR